jgi:hypothetical protein
MSDEFWKQFFTFAGIAVIQVIGLITLMITKRTNKITLENTAKLDDAAAKVDETKDAVSSVHQIANGRLTDALNKIEELQRENDSLKAEVAGRRSTDA